ncbi:hypothetical protein RUM43_012808 [Polyplax serrata]|uniref:Uncharacterized protein n=1 Tax=Polyplax serrata TaxID=468196 RepID=A0AAN8PIA3_POLSC
MITNSLWRRTWRKGNETKPNERPENVKYSDAPSALKQMRGSGSIRDVGLIAMKMSSDGFAQRSLSLTQKYQIQRRLSARERFN